MDFRWKRAHRRAARIGASALLLTFVVASVLVTRARRAAVIHARPAAAPVPAADSGLPPIEQWTERFAQWQSAGAWAGLDADLDAIREKEPDLFEWYRLGYLQARAKLGRGQHAAARELFEPFLGANHPLRDLALYHAAVAEAARGRADEAARLREALVTDYKSANYRLRALDEHVTALTEAKDVARLQALRDRLGSEDAAAVRDIESRIVELTVEQDADAAVRRGLAVLKANAGDDPADRVTRALDRPEILSRLGPEDWALLGESARGHRHYDRAVALLERALPQLPARREEILYSIGRAHFGAEQFEAAERRYLEGAAELSTPEVRGNFFYNAARSAQLQGDDARAEKHLASAIAAGGNTTRASAALTQRIRLRVHQKRYDDAAADWRTVLKKFKKTRAVVEATLSYATGLVEAGRGEAAVRALSAVPSRLLEKKDEPELAYWKARALERRNPHRAAGLYLAVLRADTPTHFAYFARHRLAAGPMTARARAEARALEARAEARLAKSELEDARALATDALLLSTPEEAPARRERLREIYRRIPAYQAVLDLQPPVFPRLPLFGEDPNAEPGRLELLLALGLFDDAAEDVIARHPPRPMASGVMRAEALRRGAAGRASIATIEQAIDDVPDEYLPELLPPLVRSLLFPRYFYSEITAQAGKHGADPRLVLSIMREESRFNVRAKSPAAARGLLQFIITTAQEVGAAVGLVDVTAEDLYEPQVIIQLGARYIADLQKQFGGNPYRAAAAYNAGPKQAALWARLASGPGDDQFLTAINFDETKSYVRKVLNSYERYREIYESGPPAGGVRAEP